MRFISAYGGLTQTSLVSESEQMSEAIADSLFTSKGANAYFKPYVVNCNPCLVDYNAILKNDNQNEISRYFTQSELVTSEARDLFKKAPSDTSVRPSKYVDSWKRRLAGFKFEMWEKVLEYYRSDFIFFDYHIFWCK